MDVNVVMMQGTTPKEAAQIITFDNIITEMKEGQTESLILQSELP